MSRARVRWLPEPFGLWSAVYPLGLGRFLSANGLTAAQAIINLQTLYQRHAQPQRQAEPAPGHVAHGSEAAQYDPGCDYRAPGESGRHIADRDEVHECPCGCRTQIILNWHRKQYAWIRRDDGTPTGRAKDRADAVVPEGGREHRYNWRGEPGSERRRLSDEFDRLCVSNGIPPLYAFEEAQEAIRQAQAAAQPATGSQAHDPGDGAQEQDPSCASGKPLC